MSTDQHRVASKLSLLKNPKDLRPVVLTFIYLGILVFPVFVPEFRNVFVFLAACFLSFVNTIVIHLHLHGQMFKSARINRIWNLLLSFGSLYPASANIPSHNHVHHSYGWEGEKDWASNDNVRFRWHLLNLIHFPNVVGPRTFEGVNRWGSTRPKFKKVYLGEVAFAFSITGGLMIYDFWATLFFVCLPQLWGARGVLRYNLIQHDACDLNSRYNHARNFVGKFYNWFVMNNGYHTIHHNQPYMHWTKLPDAHQKFVVPKQDPSLDEKSFVAYILRTYVFGLKRPKMKKGLSDLERDSERNKTPLLGLRSNDRKTKEALNVTV